MNRVEIISFLQLSSIADIKAKEYIYKSQCNKRGNGVLSEELNSYVYINKKITYWMEQLYCDEVDILKRRFINHEKLENIAISLGYKNHSSISKKIDNAIQKIYILEKEISMHK